MITTKWSWEEAEELQKKAETAGLKVIIIPVDLKTSEYRVLINE